jgi:probable HAF family extracellular repeat protein
MRRRELRLGTGLAGGALAVPLVLAVGAAAPAVAEPLPADVVYQITELAPPDGGASIGASINNPGVVAGYTRLPDEGVVHAAVWRHESMTDLGTLGGPNSAVLWPVKNSSGIVVGVAETADIDPNDEAWSCSVFFGADTEHACVGFVWQDGEMAALPTFGGTHGFATGVNNRGQVVGWAEVAETDRTCNQQDQFLGFRAALWDTTRDTMRELPPLAGDSASAATAINNRGQAVGISGDCANAVGGFSARHAVLWQDGAVTEIGDLGGEAWNTPMAINSSGTVVGFANQPGTVGAAFNEEAFVWTAADGVQALGMLDGDVRSQALGVNDAGQVVGLSRGAGGDTAVFWRDGHIVDLHTLAPGYDGRLLFANDVNNAGVITGTAISAETGQPVVFVATPVE